MNTPVKFEVKPTSITGHSLLVLPNPGYHTPKLSLQMETDLAKRLAHAANTLPELVRWVRASLEDGISENERHARLVNVRIALAAAEKVKP